MNYFFMMRTKKDSWGYIEVVGFFSALILFSNPLITSAAELRFSNYPSLVHSGDRFSVDVRLSTEGSNVNALGGKVLVSSNLKIENIKDGQSLVGVWTERPEALPNMLESSFSGIIPGGYLGENGAIFTLDLEAHGTGPAKIEFSNLTVFGNDGIATPVEVTSAPLVFTIDPRNTSLANPRIPDLFPPESFVPEIARNEDIFDNRYFLVFQTVDKQSGIDHYEVAEISTLGKASTISSAWQKTTSPYLLKDQNLQSDVYVRAVDRAGNFIVIKLPARFANVSPRKDFLLVWIAIFGFVLLLIFSLMRKGKEFLNSRKTIQ